MMEIVAFKKTATSVTSHLPVGSCENTSNANNNATNNNNNNSSSSKRASWEPEAGSILDPFHIEDLLDFSNEDIAGPIGEEAVNNNSSLTTAATATTTTTTTTTTDSSIANLSSQDHHPSSNIHADEFPIDCDEMPELEWLSTLVDDDTFSIGELPKNTFIGSKGGSYSPLSNNSSKTNTNTTANATTTNNNKRSYSNLFDIDENVGTPKDRFQVGSPISVLESSTATSSRLVNTVPGRPRSKRVRSSSANSSWSNTSCLINNPGVTNASGLIPSSLSPTTSSISDKDFVSSEENSSLYEQDGVDSTALSGDQHDDLKANLVINSVSVVAKSGKPPLQASTSKAPAGNVHSTTAAAGTPAATSTGEVQPRRCSHCLSQKTPQWRTGPDGPKTLCNACGVRYKSGRLFPEYRPALSPTFLSEVHSNSHRKVLEMRRQKGLASQASCQATSTLINSSSASSSPGEVVDGGLIYK